MFFTDIQRRVCIIALLVGSIGCIGLGISAVASGWAVGSADISPGQSQWAPKIEVKVWLGWYNSTSAVSSKALPIEIKAENDGAKALGLVTVLFLITACVLAVALANSQVVPQCPLTSVLQEHARSGLLVSGGFVCVLATTLYVALAAGTNDYFKDKFETGCIPRPDWAYMSTMLGGGLMLVAAMLTGVVPHLDMEVWYSPI